MKQIHRILGFVMAAAMLLSLGSAAFASGEASAAMPGSAPPPPPSAMAQNVEDMKNTAAISVIDGTLASDEMAVTGGSITSGAISDAFVTYDGIGDWDGSAVFGHYRHWGVYHRRRGGPVCDRRRRLQHRPFPGRAGPG